MDNLLVGLDIGTSKICTVIAKINQAGDIEILGEGYIPSKGLKKGVVINIEQASNAILKSIQKAEIQAGTEIQNLMIGVSGSNIDSITSKGVIAINGKKSNGIDNNDIKRVISSATSIVIPADREIIHILPQNFVVDDQNGIKDPIGMSGIRLEAIVHIITIISTSIKNFIKSVEMTGYKVQDIVLESLAASQAVLTEEEKDLGVLMIDIGGGTTDFAVFSDGCLQHTGFVGVGGEHITNDIAFGFKIPPSQAEKIKIKYGSALEEYVDPSQTFEIEGLGGRPSHAESALLLSQIVGARIEEILYLIKLEIEKRNLSEKLNGGIILTGGVAQTHYIGELASRVFERSVRIGTPLGIKGLHDIVANPVYSTAVGLAIYAQNSVSKPHKETSNEKDHHSSEKMKKWFDKLLAWFNEFF